MSFPTSTLSSGLQAHDNDFGLGHNGVRISLNYFDGIPDQSLLNALPNNYLKLYFKSLLKRDNTTKEKALSELLSSLDGEVDGKESQFGNDIFLLCWSQVYAKTVVNESKNVRVSGHLLTIKLISLLQKKVNKFLRDFIPLILLGTCDLDPVVSKSCIENLKSCFDNNEKKLNSLWSVFSGEILDLVREITVVESRDTLSDERYTSKEETEFKYNRILSAAIGLLLNVIERSFNTEQFHTEDKEKLVTILHSDSLWKAFNLKSPHNLKICQSITRLIDVLYRSTDFFNENKDIFKLAVRRLFKVMAQLNQKNAVSFNVLTPQIIQLLVTLSDYKRGKIWSYDKNSAERLRNFLIAAGRSTVPGYYHYMLELYETTSTIEPVKVALEDNGAWMEIWQKSLSELGSKPFLGRHATDILIDFWENYCKFLENQPNEFKSRLQSDITSNLSLDKKLNLKQPENSILLPIFTKYADPIVVQGEIERCILEDDSEASRYAVGNLITLLLNCPKCEESLSNLATFIFDHILQDTASIKPAIFAIISALLDADKQNLAEIVDKFIFEMATWLEPETFTPLSELVIKYTNSHYFNGEDNNSLTSLEDFFIGLCALDISRGSIASFLMALNPRALDPLLTSSHEIREFVNSYIQEYSYDDDNIAGFFNSNLINENNIVLLFENSVSNDHLADFCQYAGGLRDNLKLVLFERTEFLSLTMFTISDEVTTEVYDMLLPFMEHSSKREYILERLASILVDQVKRADDISDILLNDQNSLYLKVASKVLDIRPELINHFIPDSTDEYLSISIPHIDSRISLINELALNTFLLPTGSPSLSSLEKWLELIKYGLFIDRLLSIRPDLLEDRVLVLLTMLVEISNDHNCISPFPDIRFSEYQNTLFKKSDACSISLESVIEHLTGTSEGQDTITSLLLSGTHPVAIFYKSRVLFRLLQNEVDIMSRSTLIRLVPSIESSVSKVLRSKEGDQQKQLLHCSILLTLLKRLGTDESLTKLRTLLASQCIGVNASDLLKENNRTLQSLILLGNILQVDLEETNAGDFMPIVPQRLNMMLNTFNKWLDSDVVYEAEFSITRLALLRFCTLMLKLPSVRNNTNLEIFQFATRLLIDSLGVCQLDDTTNLLELRFYCLQLYDVWTSCSELTEDFEDRNDIFDGVIQLALIKYDFEVNNQVAVNFYRPLTQILTHDIKTKILLPYYDSFLDYFVDATGKLDRICQYRMIFSVLDLLIGEKQTDAVVEYELLHQKLSGQTTNNRSNVANVGSDDDELDRSDDENADNEFKIPVGIVSKLDDGMPVEYLQYADKAKFILYMWSWKLALKFFEGVSYNLRQLYINQLKMSNLVERMYDFIADQIDQVNTKGMKRVLDDYQLSEYDPVAGEFNTNNEELLEESKFLLPHILYKLFDNMGSLTSKWFLNIRDRSVRERFDKFVSHYISPVIITTELDNVASKINRLAEKNSALSIKVNRVLNEIKAGYLIDEQRLEISFKLPNNYPLSNVQVVGVSRVGISEQKWKQWIMSTQHVITGMNGTVLDSLELFARNVNLQFSGFEECAICYSILHAVDGKLPTKVCPTCHNNFHGACLYKWFRSSGNNTCPLCRSEIPFRKQM